MEKVVIQQKLSPVEKATLVFAVLVIILMLFLGTLELL